MFFAACRVPMVEPSSVTEPSEDSVCNSDSANIGVSVYRIDDYQNFVSLLLKVIPAQPIPGASLEVGTAKYVTDTQGKVSIPRSKSSVQGSARSEGYVNQDFNFSFTGSCSQIAIYLSPLSEDERTGQPFQTHHDEVEVQFQQLHHDQGSGFFYGLVRTREQFDALNLKADPFKSIGLEPFIKALEQGQAIVLFGTDSYSRLVPYQNLVNRVTLNVSKAILATHHGAVNYHSSAAYLTNKLLLEPIIEAVTVPAGIQSLVFDVVSDLHQKKIRLEVKAADILLPISSKP